ncbi:MAG: kelch repeat-containing protein [Bacteroidetes bacterium]|nr:kelch repeat-containing protein [Bacteroidota bacterium]
MRIRNAVYIICFLLIQYLGVFGQQGQWTWMKGDTTFDSPGHYGIQGVADPANNPPALWGANGWVDQQGNFWLFGGSLGWGIYNDLWRYDISLNIWTWVKGPGVPNQHGVYGILGVPADSNLPKYRAGFTTWVDLQGDLWLFGGEDGGGALNDLWRYQISTNQWTWMKV